MSNVMRITVLVLQMSNYRLERITDNRYSKKAGLMRGTCEMVEYDQNDSYGRDKVEASVTGTL